MIYKFHYGESYASVLSVAPCSLPALPPQGGTAIWTSCSGVSKLAPIPPATWPSITIERLRQRRRPKHNPHRSVVAGFQKRNRNPTVGAMLLRWRKPEANPPFT